MRRSPNRVAAVAAVLSLLLLVSPLLAAQDEAGPPDAQEQDPWEARVLEVLRTPPDHPRRVMLVFPLVEAGSEDGRIGWGRGLVAMQAMWRSSFAPERLLDTWDFWMHELFVDQQLIGPGRMVTPTKIENTCAAFECPNYTTGTLAIDEATYRAELTFHGEHGEQRKVYSGPREQIHTLPCAIAQDVVDYMGVKPTALSTTMRC